MSDSPQFPDKYPDESEEEDRPRAVDHFLTDLDKLINRYSFEYELSFAEIIGCLTIQQQLVMDAMTELAMQAHLDDLEEELEELDTEEEDLDLDDE